jgi:hypothetical protein
VVYAQPSHGAEFACAGVLVVAAVGTRLRKTAARGEGERSSDLNVF